MDRPHSSGDPVGLEPGAGDDESCEELAVRGPDDDVGRALATVVGNALGLVHVPMTAGALRLNLPIAGAIALIAGLSLYTYSILRDRLAQMTAGGDRGLLIGDFNTALQSFPLLPPAYCRISRSRRATPFR